MGNIGCGKSSSSKKVITVVVDHFCVQNAPQIPSKWKNKRLTAKVWQEFREACVLSANLSNVEQIVAKYDKCSSMFYGLTICYCLCFLYFIIGIVLHV